MLTCADLTGTDYFKDTVDPWKNWVFALHAKPKATVVSEDLNVLIFVRPPHSPGRTALSGRKASKRPPERPRPRSAKKAAAV